METSQVVDETLKKVARGTAIVFFGTIVSLLLGIGTLIIIVRYITQDEYGIFSLASVIVGILIVVAALGLPEAVTRYIGYFRGNNELHRIKSVVFSSLGFAITTAIISGIILYFISDLLATEAFNKPDLSTPLKIMSAGIPFAVLTTMLITIFRGFDRVDVRVFFQDFIGTSLLLVSLGVIFLLDLHFLGVVYAVVASSVLTCLLLTIYALRKSPLPTYGQRIERAMGKELLLFSLPLLGIAMLGLVVTWTDTLMLGYFKDSSDVGLYNGALPLARLVPLPLLSTLFIYVPVLAQLYAKNLNHEMKRTYQVLTKWTTSLSLPLFLLLMVFPEDILNIVFGNQYIEAAQALRILSVGFFFDTFLGANGSILMIMGRTKLLMWASLFTASLNVALNAILIPHLGIVGAAIASLAAYSAMNMYILIRLYQLCGMQPFTWNYLKPVITCSMIVLLIYVFTTTVLTITFWMLPLFLILFIFIYGLSLILTRSFDNEDISLLLAIEKRTGVNTAPIKNILRRFV